MAYYIDPLECDNCGACEPACPQGAISEQEGVRVIDPQKCDDCGDCIGSCTVGAIHPGS